MDKITYDMLGKYGPVLSGIFRLLYPDGLTITELEQKAQEYNWLRIIYEDFKGVG